MPQSTLPDLLKNNYLTGSALMLVKDVNNIDQIWKGLKDAFGDTKQLLKKKLSQLNQVENSKSRDSSKAVDALSQIYQSYQRDIISKIIWSTETV